MQYQTWNSLQSLQILQITACRSSAFQCPNCHSERSDPAFAIFSANSFILVSFMVSYGVIGCHMVSYIHPGVIAQWHSCLWVKFSQITNDPIEVTICGCNGSFSQSTFAEKILPMCCKCATSSTLDKKQIAKCIAVNSGVRRKECKVLGCPLYEMWATQHQLPTLFGPPCKKSKASFLFQKIPCQPNMTLLFCAIARCSCCRSHGWGLSCISRDRTDHSGGEPSLGQKKCSIYM